MLEHARMDGAAADDSPSLERADLPASAYPHHCRIFNSNDAEVHTGLVFDSQAFAVMSIAHPPKSETPDLNVDKDGDRILILMEGDLVLQIGDDRFRLGEGDAVRIPRGSRFGRSCSQAGAHLLLIRAKPLRSFSILR